MKNISSLLDQYQGFLVDIWGVIHDGEEIFPGTLDCLSYLKKQGKPVVFLTNSPRRSGPICDYLATKGLKHDLYQDILSSGEFFYQDLKHQALPNFTGTTPKLFCIDEFCDDYIFHGANVEIVDCVSKADFLVVLTVAYTEEELNKYNPDLEKALALKKPMICVNPDQNVFKGDKKIVRPGLLAQIFMQKGGHVYFYGKPDPKIFHAALRLFSPVCPKTILFIGDHLETDIQGAINSGLDSALVMRDTLDHTWWESHPSTKPHINPLPSNSPLFPTFYISGFSL